MGFNPMQKRGAKGTDLGGEFVGPKSVAHFLLKLLNVKHDEHGTSLPARPHGSVGSFRTRGGSRVHVSLPSRPMRVDDRIQDPHNPRRMGTITALHGSTQELVKPGEGGRPAEYRTAPERVSVAWDDGTHEVLPRGSVHDRLQEPRRTYQAVPGERAPKLDAGGSLSSDPATREVQVENRIRAAYRDAVAAGDRGYNGHGVRPGEPGQGVRLSAIRDRLGEDIPRSEVDAALKRLSRQNGVSVGPDENQKTLTAADRAAAVDIFGQPHNMLTFERGAETARPLPSTPQKRAADMVAAGRTDRNTAERLLRGESPTSIADDRTQQGHRERLAAAAGRMGISEEQLRAAGLGAGPEAPARRGLTTTGVESPYALPPLHTMNEPAPKSAAVKVARAKAPRMSDEELRRASPEDLERMVADGRITKARAVKQLETTNRQVRDSLATVLSGDVHQPQDMNSAIGRSLAGRQDLMKRSDAALERLRLSGRTPNMSAATRASVAKPEFNADAVRAKLAAANTREEGHAALQGLTGAQLKELGKVSGTSYVGATTNEGMRNRLVEHHVGFKLNSAAIRNYHGSGEVGTQAERTLRSAPSSSAVAKVARAKAAAPLSAGQHDALRALERHGDMPAGVMQARVSNVLEREGLIRREGNVWQITHQGRQALATRAPVQRDFGALARDVRHGGTPENIESKLTGLNATELNSLAHELNIALPAAAKGAPARRRYIAQTVWEHYRRTTGGL